jgi:hypothetical protein
MPTSPITVPASFDLVLEKDAAMTWVQQMQVHRVLFHQLTDNSIHRSNETTLAHWMLRVKGFVERRVPLGFTTFDPNEVNREAAEQIVKEDCARAVADLVLWEGAAKHPATLRELLSLYLGAGYAQIDGSCRVGSDEQPVTFLEAAMCRGHLVAATVLIELGADLSRVPAAPKAVYTRGGVVKTIAAGDIDGYIDHQEFYLPANFAPVRAAMMQCSIAVAQAHATASAAQGDAPARRRATL